MDPCCGSASGAWPERAPPYTFSRGSKNAKAPRTFLATIVGTVTTPSGVVADPAAVVNVPAGSETFAGLLGCVPDSRPVMNGVDEPLLIFPATQHLEEQLL